MLRSVGSLMIILCYFSLASFIPPSSDGITMLLWSSLIDTYNNSLGTIFISVWPSIDTLRES